MTMAGDWRGWAERLAADPGTQVAAAATLGLAAAAEAVGRAVGSDASGWFGLVLCLLALTATVPLALPRPVPAAVIVTAANALSVTPFGDLTVAGLIAELVVVYRLGRAGAGPLAAGLTVPFVVLALAGVAPDERFGPPLLAMLAPASAMAGIAWRARAEALTHQAARRATATTLTEHTARGERVRIARELHDVVAHHISMIAVRAETARLTVPGMPEAGARRLAEIGDTARAGLTEMRRLLGVLREDTAGTVDRRPQPGLGQVTDLVDDARDASGTGTRLIVSGPPVALDPGVELAAYRIIQEALTNARRHAPGAAVDVELRFTERSLLVRVRDNGPGTRPPDRKSVV